MVSHVVSHVAVVHAVVAVVSSSSWRLVCIRPGPVGQPVGHPAPELKSKLHLDMVKALTESRSLDIESNAAKAFCSTFGNSKMAAIVSRSISR